MSCARLASICIPIELPDTDMSSLWLILAPEAAAAFDEITRDGRVDTLARQDDDAWPNVFRAGRFIPGGRVHQRQPRPHATDAATWRS